ncbi:hypothetical protein D2T31_09770 [Sinirhodobacter populi]|uniref:EF-hand domain-containing protein n=1 Tax=Paenirhodobacter populi TaxID=2306993 RepID=A0A443KA92_9RHOB|nr:EF-hand domain-containing protein [Sinirhodobacter populi]RWR29717.1 hypothetical protein D2T31_09770 [Sinirhodobacter populi]
MKPTIRPTLLAGLLALTTAIPALAQEAPPPATEASQPDARPGPARGWPAFDLNRFDADGDGRVSLAEIQEKRRAEAAALDANGDGKLSAEEMVNAEIERLRPRIEARVQARIQALDVDGDGLLSAAELAMPPVPERMFERLDADGDGVVTREEMRAMHERMMPRMQAQGPKGRPGDRGAQQAGRQGPGHPADHGPAGKPGNRPAPADAPPAPPAEGDAN